ncbi:hypothetical protein EVAR_20125_1 [Eumeta japonica]|uniref:Uncharacterized protein n=1 Tax=Eumeta variegata TaxID=151549 RepID=A0A4C1V3Y8_EUMVA|nr:hypothetical protein EVAR_20125_1 [Eumeta japonica]
MRTLQGAHLCARLRPVMTYAAPVFAHANPSTLQIPDSSKQLPQKSFRRTLDNHALTASHTDRLRYTKSSKPQYIEATDNRQPICCFRGFWSVKVGHAPRMRLECSGRRRNNTKEEGKLRPPKRAKPVCIVVSDSCPALDFEFGVTLIRYVGSEADLSPNLSLYVERITEHSLADVDVVSAAAGCGRGTNPAQVLDEVYR